MATDFLISFDDLKAGNAAVKRLVQAFTRAGATVASSDIDPKTKRTSGVNYRQVLITFTDNQKVLLGVKTTGDIFEVRVNGSALAIKNQDNQVKAVGEIARALDAGRAKFQAKMARTKAVLPKGITTAAPKMEQRLQEAETTLDAEIAAAQARVAELRAELGEPVMDSAASGNKPGFYVRFKDNSDPAFLGESLTAAKNKYDAWANRGAGRKLLDKEYETKKNLHWVERSHGIDADGNILWGNLDLTDSMLDSVHTAAGETFDGGEWDTLVAMKQAAKVEDGDVPSKSSRDSLVERGFVERGDGMNWLTDKGREVAAALDAAGDVLDAAKPTDLEEVFIRGEKGKFYISRADRIADSRFMPVRDKNGKIIKGMEVHADNLHPTQEKADASSAKIKKAWNMDSVDVPLASFERPEVVEAQAIAARLAAGDTLDAADLSHALATLHSALDVVETNHPINLAEGDIAQADLEEKAAESFRDAIKILEERKPLAA